MSGEPSTTKTPAMESIYGIKSDAKLIGEMLAKVKSGDFTYVHTDIIQERVDSILRYLAALESSYLDIEDEAAIKHYKFLLQEYGIERDEKLVESARKFKQKVLGALPPFMRKDAERITEIKEKCEEVRSTLDTYYGREIAEYYAYNFLRDAVDEVELLAEGKPLPPKPQTVNVEANASAAESKTGDATA